MDENIKYNVKKVSSQRVSTGIQGFDELIQGGFPKGSFTVISGNPGTGKTIYGIQFLWNGLVNEEKCLYICLEQPRWDIIEQAWQFGWDLESMQAKGLLTFYSLDSDSLYDSQRLNEIISLAKQQHFTRIVLDSITSFVYAVTNSSTLIDAAERGLTPSIYSEMARSNVLKLMDEFKKTGSTIVGTAQNIKNDLDDSGYTVSAYRGDGLIVVNAGVVGNTLARNIQVKKMRKTKIDGAPYSFDFSEQGILINK
jgi:circadian clock protein KaiC